MAVQSLVGLLYLSVLLMTNLAAEKHGQQGMATPDQQGLRARHQRRLFGTKSR